MGVAPLLSLLLSLGIVAPDVGGDGMERRPETMPEVMDSTPPGDRLAQLTIEQRVIIRVPMMRPLPPPAVPAAPAPVDWEERKGPKCIPLRRLRAASIVSPRGVDLMLRGGPERMRALLGRECSPASLYSGFYIEPNEDGQLCAGRDKVLARSGADCTIRKLVRLVPDED